MGAGDFDVVSRYGPGDGSTPILMLFTGEGSHSAQTDIPSLKLSSQWSAVEAALERSGLPDLESLLATVLGSHGAPLSPVVTTVINLLNYGRWREAGFEPSVVVGHSIGEVAAAHVAGLLSMDDTIALAHGLGRIGASLDGAMLHTRVSTREVRYMLASTPALSPFMSAPALQARTRPWDDESICIAAINTAAGATGEVGVSLCGPHARVSAWLDTDERSKRLPPLHPWHHPAYALRPGLFAELKALPKGNVGSSSSSSSVAFVSSTSSRVAQLLDASYWFSWLSQPGAHDHTPPLLLRTTTRRHSYCALPHAATPTAHYHTPPPLRASTPTCQHPQATRLPPRAAISRLALSRV